MSIVDWASYGLAGGSKGDDPDDPLKKLAFNALQRPDLDETTKAKLLEIVRPKTFSERLFGSKRRDSDIQTILSGTKPSAGQEFAQTESNRARSLQKIEQNPSSIADASTSLPALGGVQLTESGQLTPKLQEQLDAIRSKTLGIDSEIDREGKKADTDYKKTATSINKAEAERIKLAKPIADRAAAKFSSGRLWEAVRDGIATPEETDALYAIPTYKAHIENLQQQDLTAQGLKARMKGDHNESLEILSRQMLLKTGTTVAPEFLKQILQNPSLGKKYENMKEADVPENERGLWEAAKVRKTYMMREGRAIANDAADTFRKLFPRLGDVQARRITMDESIANEMNNAAQQAFMGTGLEPPKFVLGKIKSFGTDQATILRIGGDGPVFTNPAKSYISKDISGTGKDVQVGPNGEIEEQEEKKTDTTQVTDSTKAMNYEKLKKRYPNETPAQIRARVEKGES